MTTHAPRGYTPQTPSPPPQLVQYPNPQTGEMATYAVYPSANGPVGYIVEPGEVFDPKPRGKKNGSRKVLISLAAIAAVIGLAFYALPRYVIGDHGHSVDSAQTAPETGESGIFDTLPSGETHAPKAPHESGPQATVPAPKSNAPLGTYSPVPGAPKVEGVSAEVSSVASRAAGDLNKFWESASPNNAWNAPWHYYSLDNGDTQSDPTDEMATCDNVPTIKITSQCGASGIAWNAQGLTQLRSAGGDGAVMLAMGVAYGQYVLSENGRDASTLNAKTLQASACLSTAAVSATSGWINGPSDANRAMSAWLDQEKFSDDLNGQVLEAFQTGLRSGVDGCFSTYAS